jgi:hypothetical protein
MLLASTPSSSLRPTTRRVALTTATVVWLSFASGCGGSERSRVAVDCAADDAYDVRILEDYEGGSPNFIAFHDQTPGAVQTTDVGSIDGGRCGSESAVVLRARGSHDWGCAFASSSTSWDGNASGYDGFSFWTRSPGLTMKGFSFVVEDPTTLEAGGRCVRAEGMAGVSTVTPDIHGGITVTRPVPAANACGNQFFAVLVASETWQFHRVPFHSLAQAPWPNRTASGIDRSHILGWGVRMPKESEVELWIDDFGLYRERASHVGE